MRSSMAAKRGRAWTGSAPTHGRIVILRDNLEAGGLCEPLNGDPLALIAILVRPHAARAEGSEIGDWGFGLARHGVIPTKCHATDRKGKDYLTDQEPYPGGRERGGALGGDGAQ